jgi:uncharacterized membrane protein YdjX (TVP38/TMEM64 family)
VHPSPRVASTKLLMLLALAAFVAIFFALDLGRFVSLAGVKEQQARLAALYDARPLVVLSTFFAAYVVVTAASLPGAAVLTLAAGAIFGLAAGTVVVSCASTFGATLAFLSSRFVLRDSVRRRLGGRLADVEAGIERDGAFYLFALRLVPLVPFFVVNLAMGLTAIRTRTFYLVSQAGMLAGTIVYVNAGTHLARIDSLRGVLSPGVLVSFALVGLLPLMARKVLRTVRRQRGRAAEE